MLRYWKQINHWLKVFRKTSLILLSVAVLGFIFFTGYLHISRYQPEYFRGYSRSFVTNKTSPNCLSRDVDLRILVLTYKRAESLSRLLKSLNNAEYDGDNVHLEIWVDVPMNNVVNADVMKVAKTSKFKHGCSFVNVHRGHVGIIGQWIYTWQTRNNTKEIAVIFEDDITVSPYFYRYLKIVHRKYGYLPFVNGFSLQGESIKHNGKGRLDMPKEHGVFLYPTLGTWGFSPNQKNWVKFVNWFTEIQHDQSVVPLVPDNIASEWYQTYISTGRAETMWEMWHIYYAWKHWELTLYPNFPENRGLTFNWKAEGLHYKGTAELTAGSDLDGLLLTWDPNFSKQLHDIPVLVGNDGIILQPPADIPDTT